MQYDVLKYTTEEAESFCQDEADLTYTIHLVSKGVTGENCYQLKRGCYRLCSFGPPLPHLIKQWSPDNWDWSVIDLSCIESISVRFTKGAPE